jgi:tRNA threonylcarbamoyladenosine biosynthesis protein TsaE
LTTRTSHSVHDTEAVAAELARSLRGGECVALYGDLGAGKTQFVRGVVRGLGADPHSVSSPTFVLLNVYESGRLKVFHLDAYRVRGPGDFEDIGFAELLEQRGVVVVEWAERVEELLPVRRINVRIDPTGKNSRLIGIESIDPIPEPSPGSADSRENGGLAPPQR